jgi:itaconate CoA-transferase
MLPLEGTIVVSLEQAVAAPFATRQLGDLGARVIKIERPGDGDFARRYDTTVRGMASHFVWLNRSKESVTLNVKAPEGREVLEQLLARADVFVQNLVPGAAQRLGLDGATLHAKFPRLIICNISGYGSSGPYANKKAYDLLIQSEAGLLSITGTDGSPAKVGISIADIAGGMYAFSGILTALLTRAKTGNGVALEVTLLEALGEWMGYPAYYTTCGAPPSRTGASHAAIAPYGPFAARDEKVIYLGIQNEPEWQRFCDIVLDQPHLAHDSRFASNSLRVSNRAELHAHVEEVFSTRSADELLSRLDEAQIAYGRMNTVEEFLRHPQLAARNRWREVDSPVGPLPALLPPVTMGDVEPAMGRIPDLGEHTEPVLRELGIAAETICEWRRSGIV